MYYKSIPNVVDLVTWDQCYEALEALESDYRNYYGDLNVWRVTHKPELTVAAKKKLKAIQNKMERIIIRDHAIKLATVGKCHPCECCSICDDERLNSEQ